MSRLTPDALRESHEQLFRLQRRITETHGFELALGARTGLAVVGSLSFLERSNPLALIYEGGAGKGKSLLIDMLNPDRSQTRERSHRLDNFTPKSFVTHTANVKKGELENIDLLPKIKDKVLLTKELAPLLRGREEELKANFSILTAVLDGKGYVSSSGTQGVRGYEGAYVFNWLGGTTPIPAKTDSIMAQLGNRLLRYECSNRSKLDERTWSD